MHHHISHVSEDQTYLYAGVARPLHAEEACVRDRKVAVGPWVLQRMDLHALLAPLLVREGQPVASPDEREEL